MSRLQPVQSTLQPDSNNYTQLTTYLDTHNGIAWGYMHAEPRPCFSPSLLKELHAWNNFLVQEICSGVEPESKERVWEEWLGFPAMRMRNGRFPLPDKPGLGFVLDAHLARIRWQRVWRQVRIRWAAASSGALVAGVVAGALGGLLLAAMSPAAPLSAVVVLALIGGAAGAGGGAGIGAGLETAEALSRSRRGAALVACGGVGGAVVALPARWLVQWTLEALFGLSPAISAGPLEGADGC